MTPLVCLGCHPGPSVSTNDVYVGLMSALVAAGHQVHNYPLDRALVLNTEFTRLLRQRGYVQQDDAIGAQYGAGVWALDRALHHDVEWVIIVSPFLFLPEFMQKLQRAGRKVCAIFTESPYWEREEWARAAFADVIFNTERTAAARWAQERPNVYYLPHAHDPAVHRPQLEDDEDVPAHDVVFVGTGWRERIELFEAVDWTGINFGLYGQWKGLARRSPLRAHLREPRPIPNARTAALYRRAKIGLNLYRADATAESLNPRAYELGAAGLFHVSDYRAELSEVFDDLVPTFRTAAELEQTLRFYLADDASRALLAHALPAAVAPHTFAARAATVAERLAAYSREREVLPVS